LRSLFVLLISNIGGAGNPVNEYRQSTANGHQASKRSSVQSESSHGYIESRFIVHDSPAVIRVHWSRSRGISGLFLAALATLTTLYTLLV
jgi:hypothetical protein